MSNWGWELSSAGSKADLDLGVLAEFSERHPRLCACRGLVTSFQHSPSRSPRKSSGKNSWGPRGLPVPSTSSEHRLGQTRGLLSRLSLVERPCDWVGGGLGPRRCGDRRRPCGRRRRGGLAGGPLAGCVGPAAQAIRHTRASAPRIVCRRTGPFSACLFEQVLRRARSRAMRSYNPTTNASGSTPSPRTSPRIE